MKVYDLVKKHGWLALQNLNALGISPSYLSHIFFVDQNNPNALDADNGEHGQSWEKPYKTIAYAITRNNATLDWSPDQGEWWGQNNYILIAPGKYAGHLASVPYGCTVIGLGSSMDFPTDEGSVIIYCVDDTVITTSSLTSVTFKNITFYCDDPTSGKNVVTAIMNNSAFINCRFHTNIANLDTHLEIGDMTRSVIRGCKFSSGTTHAATAINICAGSKTAFFGSLIEENLIGAATNGILVDATLALSGGGTFIRKNEIAYPVTGIAIKKASHGIRITNNTIMASSDCIENPVAALTTGNWANKAGKTSWEDQEESP